MPSVVDYFGDTFLKTTVTSVATGTATKIADANPMRKKAIVSVNVAQLVDPSTNTFKIGGDASVSTAYFNVSYARAGNNFIIHPNLVTIEIYTGEIWAMHSTGAPLDFSVIEF